MLLLFPVTHMFLQVRVAFSYELPEGAAATPTAADLSGNEEASFETVVSKKSLKQRRRLTSDPHRFMNGADSFNDTDSNKLVNSHLLRIVLWRPLSVLGI